MQKKTKPEELTDCYMDTIVRSFQECGSINRAAAQNKISFTKARKILITKNAYSNALSLQIKELAAQGKEPREIAERLSISESSVNSMLPYETSGLVSSGSSAEEMRARKNVGEEEKKEAVRIVRNCTNDEELSDKLWHAVILFEGHPFQTSKGLPFDYKVRGGELFCDRKKKSITQATILIAYKRAAAAAAAGTPFKGPKQMGVFGASYIYSILKQTGLLPG